MDVALNAEITASASLATSFLGSRMLLGDMRLKASATLTSLYEDRFFNYTPTFTASLSSDCTTSSILSLGFSLQSELAASASVFSILQGITPNWVILHAPVNRTIFRRYDFGTIAYDAPTPLNSDEIDEIVLANTDGSEENNIDFIRRNDGWFAMATVVEFPPKPYELTFIHYDNVNKKTYSRQKRFFFKREMPSGLAGKPETVLQIPLARNIFRRVDFGTIAYTSPSAQNNTQIDEIVIGNIDINDDNQIDFILRYDGWFVNSYLVHYPKEPYEITFIRHDNTNKITYSASGRLKLQREVAIF